MTPEEKEAEEAGEDMQETEEREPDAQAEEKLAALEAEKQKLFDQLLRLKAEFENYRKRTDRDKPEFIRHGKAELLQKLIPLFDVLLSAHEEVVRHAELTEGGPTAELVRGLELIFEQFTKLFEAEGVEVIETVGMKFDYHLHDVLGQVETDEYDEGTVVEELQRGYLLDGKTLRPARVRIAKKTG